MDELRLGDIIDDYCIKCRRMTNHAIVSIVEEQAAKGQVPLLLSRPYISA